MSSFASVPGGSGFNMPKSAAMFASTPGGPMPGEYLPKQYAEVVTYDQLWAAANPSGGESLAGAQAVPFFQKSGVDNGILRQIWGLSTSTSTMTKTQFYTAIRYITMVQNGEIPISKERLQASSSVNFPPPKFNGIKINVPPPPTAYAVSSEDLVKYRALFNNYDTNKDGLVSGTEARVLFDRSGLDPNTLGTIWSMSDVDRDGSLTEREFSIAFHLILCVSKKGLPVPPALPSPLISFLQSPSPSLSLSPSPPGSTKTNTTSTPSLSLSLPSSSVYSSTSSTSPSPSLPPIPPNTPSITTTTPPHVPNLPLSHSLSHSLSIGSSSFDAFNDVGPPSSRTPPSTSPTSTPRGGVVFTRGSSNANVLTDKEVEQHKMELGNSVTALTETARKSISVSDLAAESSARSTGDLKALLQQMGQEKVAMNAAVSTAERGVSESSAKLQSTVSEVVTLRSELDELRKKCTAAFQSQSQLESQLSQASFERRVLLSEIDSMRRQYAADTGELASISADIAASETSSLSLSKSNSKLTADRNELNVQIATIKAETKTLRAIVSAMNQERLVAKEEIKRLGIQLTAVREREKSETRVNEEKESELKTLKDNYQKAQTDKSQVITELASLSSISPSLSSPPPHSTYTPPPPLPASPALSLSRSMPQPAEEPASVPFSGPSSINFGTFDDSSDPFATSSGPSGPPSTSASQTSGPPNNGFESFGDDFGADSTTPGSANAKKGTTMAFEDFGDPDDAFGATSDAFSAPSEASHKTAPKSDGFGDFGDPDDAFGAVDSFPAPPNTTSTGTDDAFGAVDSFSPVASPSLSLSHKHSLSLSVSASNSVKGSDPFASFNDTDDAFGTSLSPSLSSPPPPSPPPSHSLSNTPTQSTPSNSFTAFDTDAFNSSDQFPTTTSSVDKTAHFSAPDSVGNSSFDAFGSFDNAGESDKEKGEKKATVGEGGGGFDAFSSFNTNNNNNSSNEKEKMKNEKKSSFDDFGPPPSDW